MSQNDNHCWLRLCVNYIGVNDEDVHICRAFPDGIPHDILCGNNPHLDPYPGDSGIHFEKDITYG